MKERLKDAIWFVLLSLILIAIVYIITYSIAMWGLEIMTVEKMFNNNPSIIILGILVGIGSIFCIVGVIIYQFLKNILLIPSEKFLVEEEYRKTSIKYVGKCELVINNRLADIRWPALQKDVLGNYLSFFVKLRIFFSLKNHINIKLGKTSNKNNLIKNKEILSELSENSIGVRKATDLEIEELAKRIKANRLLFFPSLFLALAWSSYLLGLSNMPFKLKIFMGLIIVALFIVFFSNYYMRLHKLSYGEYLIIRCEVCDKKYRSRHSYRIRCRDKKGQYIDAWFECNMLNYNNNMCNIIVVKQKNGWIYINSFDKLWRRPSYVIKI